MISIRNFLMPNDIQVGPTVAATWTMSSTTKHQSHLAEKHPWFYSSSFINFTLHLLPHLHGTEIVLPLHIHDVPRRNTPFHITLLACLLTVELLCFLHDSQPSELLVHLRMYHFVGVENLERVQC